MSTQARAGNFKLKRAAWNNAFLEELEQAGPDDRLYDHDDQWDAASSAFNYLCGNSSEMAYTQLKTPNKVTTMTRETIATTVMDFLRTSGGGGRAAGLDRVPGNKSAVSIPVRSDSFEEFVRWQLGLPARRSTKSAPSH
jgi:hypothetical protein